MSYSALARKIHCQTPVIDAHGHTLDLAFNLKKELHLPLGGLTDVPLMRAGGVSAQLTACWVPDAAIGGPHASRRPLQRILQISDYLHLQLSGESGDYAMLATSASDIEAAAKSGKVAFVFGMEGGDALKGDLSVLRTLHRLGLRHLGLVHEGRNHLGTATQVWDGPHMRLYDSGIDAAGGLTPAGREVVREMNRLGMLVDVTHMVEASFWDALETTREPVVATHGNARSLQDTVRYLSDEQIRAVAATGGVVCPSPLPLGPGRESPSLDMLLNHIDYMVELVGPGHVGFGTDFLDQTGSRPTGLEDIGASANLTIGLLERGYAPQATGKILGANFLRVFKAATG